jgi:nucleoside-diphosphate kinase
LVERTLILVKPDGVQRGLTGEIIRRFERRGLAIIGLKLVSVSKAVARSHYKEHVGKPFFKGLVDYITSCPVVAMVVEGPKAIELCRATIGATDPLAATPGSIRGDFGATVGRNLVHGSDSVKSAKREVKLFFKASELVAYKRATQRWITE